MKEGTLLNRLTRSHSLVAVSACVLLAACGGTSAGGSSPVSSVVSQAAPAAAAATAPAKPSVSASAAAAASAKPSAAAAASGGARTHLTVNAASLASISNLLLLVAADGGILAKHGLDVDLQQVGGTQTIIPVIKGDAEVCQCDLTQTLGAVQTGTADVRFVAGTTVGYGTKIVLRKDIADKAGITSASSVKDRIAALKGLKIGITGVGSGTDQVTRIVLEQGGMNPDKDVEIVAIGDANNLPTALAGKKIDAFTMTQPVPQQAIVSGDAVMLVDPAAGDVPSLGTSLQNGVVFTTDYIGKHRDIVQSFADAMVEADQTLQQNKEQMRTLIKGKRFGQMAQSTFDVAFDGQVALTPKSPKLEAPSVQAGIDLLKHFSNKPVTVTPDQLADYSFVK
jgi:NitT/TauT family transport system substrate-binding protein